jgi:HEAT repeat protein
LVRLLDDPHPAVRSEAIAWVADHADEALVERLIGMLTDPTPLCRHTATDALLRAGSALPSPLAAHLADGRHPSLPVLLDVAAARPDHRYLAAALRLATSRRPRIRAGAARLLGTIGGDTATATLAGLLDDADPVVRAAAATSLGHLRHWPAASAIAGLLRDRSWDVRRASGEALVEVGAPGRLLLRRYTHDPDRFAADMAGRILLTAELRPDPVPR